MGLDVFVYCYTNGEPAAVSTEAVLRCFSGFIASQAADGVDLEFGPADSCVAYFDTTGSTTSGFLLSRPRGDRRLGECLYAVMQLGHFSLLIPGEEGVIVSSAAAVQHMPHDMLQELGGARVPKDLDDFQLLFFGS